VVCEATASGCSVISVKRVVMSNAVKQKTVLIFNKVGVPFLLSNDKVPTVFEIFCGLFIS